MSLTAGIDLELVRRLEAHAVQAWPASRQRELPDGWVLRATPGLDRGRSNHALPPLAELSEAQIEAGVRAVREFASAHGTRPGIQVSPLELQGRLASWLTERGWQTRWPVVVMIGEVAQLRSGPGLDLDVADRATPEWLSAWARCEPGRDVDAHAATVFRRLAGRAAFVRSAQDAVGIAVESDGLVGLFCLAVAPELRRRGLGTTLVRGMLARSGAAVAYLQVESANHPAIALYDHLGFERAYTYCHYVAPQRG